MIRLLWRYLRVVLPAVETELFRWHRYAQTIPDPLLRQQALSSINTKTFHCQGGAVFAASRYANPRLLQFIVAFQTISDYLDNLCDRAGVFNGAAFRQLHQSMLDAINPAEPQNDYYQLYPQREDGGYLAALVSQCQKVISTLSHYDAVHADMVRLVSLYVDLQVYKHDQPDTRVEQLQAWFAVNGLGTQLFWWEYAAACGSTLAMFALIHMASQQAQPQCIQELLAFYFPWTCGLHILLDYLIDEEEDIAEGDLNFVSFYPNASCAESRLRWLFSQAKQQLPGQQEKDLHVAVLYGLPAMYLSDPKVNQQKRRAMAQRLITAGGSTSANLYKLCRLWRWKTKRLPQG